jgi:hypothetical protein
MGRSLLIVVSDDSTVVQKTKNLGAESNVTVNTYSSQQWSEGLEDPYFRQNLQTETVTPLAGGQQGAKVYQFPQRGNNVDTSANNNGKKVSTINELESAAIIKQLVSHDQH